MNAPAQPAEAAAARDLDHRVRLARARTASTPTTRSTSGSSSRIFYGPHWCYVGLDAEIPDRGDFKRTFVGEREVIMVRDADGAINVIENRCAHRGVAFCQQNFGHAKRLHLPLSPVELRPEGQPHGPALPPRREVHARTAGADQRRHAGRFPHRGQRSRSSSRSREGRRGVRVLRPLGRGLRQLPRPRCSPGSSACSTAATAEACSATRASAFRATGS